MGRIAATRCHQFSDIYTWRAEPRCTRFSCKHDNASPGMHAKMKTHRAKVKEPPPEPPAALPPSPPVRAGAREAVVGVGMLASELVHALRNPVSALSTSIELLTAGLADPDDLPQLYQAMRNQLGRLTDLLSRCGELSRLSSLTFAPLDFVDLVRARIETRARDLTAQGVSASLSLPQASLPMLADATHLGSTIDALVNNALEAMPSGGTLVVRVERHDEQSEAVLTVQDTGHGIPAAMLPNVFRLFFTTRPGAAGVGLSIARQVITAHGGTIDIHSEEGRGTVVTVRLPLVRS